jgi:hypothetical protein
MNYSRRNTIIAFSVFAVIFAVFYGWISFITAKTRWIETKVQQAMATSMQGLYPEWQRIEIHNVQANEVYYTPIVADAERRSELTRHVLELLNQDTSVPPVKIAQVAMQTDYGVEEDILTSFTTVEYPLIAGIEKSITVKSSVPLTRYKALH